MAAVGVHHIKMSDAVALKLPVETGVGDLRSAGRGDRPIVRAFAAGELLDGAILDGERVNLAPFEVIVGVRRALGGDIDRLPIPAPCQPPPPAPAPIIQVPPRISPRR